MKGSSHVGAAVGALGAQGLVNVLLVEEQAVGLERVVINTGQLQLVVAGENVAYQRDALADLPAELLRQFPSRDAGRALALECQLLIVRHRYLGYDGKQLVGLDGEAREKIALIAVAFVRSPEPLPDLDLAHAGNMPDLFLV